MFRSIPQLGLAGPAKRIAAACSVHRQEQQQIWGKASLKWRQAFISHDRNSAQVDLCAHGTRCPFERFAAFIGYSTPPRQALKAQHAFFIAVLAVTSGS